MKRKKGKRYIFLAERREGKEGEKGKKKGGDTHLVSCKSGKKILILKREGI